MLSRAKEAQVPKIAAHVEHHTNYANNPHKNCGRDHDNKLKLLKNSTHPRIEGLNPNAENKKDF